MVLNAVLTEIEQQAVLTACCRVQESTLPVIICHTVLCLQLRAHVSGLFLQCMDVWTGGVEEQAKILPYELKYIVPEENHMISKSNFGFR